MFTPAYSLINFRRMYAHLILIIAVQTELSFEFITVWIHTMYDNSNEKQFIGLFSYIHLWLINILNIIHILIFFQTPKYLSVWWICRPKVNETLPNLFQIDHMKNDVVNSQQSLEATNLYICKPLFLSFTYFVSNPTRYYTTYFWIYDFKIALHLSSSIQHLHKILVVFDSALFYNFHFICCNSFSNKQQ